MGAEKVARPGFETPTIQPLACRYTDPSTLATPGAIQLLILDL